MKVTKTLNNPTNVSLTVSADPSELDRTRAHVLTHHFADVKVPGFRAGRAPAHMIERHIDQQVFLNEVMEHAINELYRQAIDAEHLRPVGQPQIEVKKFVPYTDLEFSVTQDIIGKVVLPDYKAVRLAPPKVDVTAADVSTILQQLRERQAERKTVERPAKSGDEVIIDFKGTDEKGSPVSGADGRDYPLTLGSGSFIPGFEDEVIGLKAGDKKDFKVTFPADYGVAALRSQKVTFAVTAKKVNALILPKLDDSFAPKVGPFKTPAELKADIKKQLLAERQQAAKNQYESQLIEQISAKAKVDIPEFLIEEQLDRMEDEEKRNLAFRGQTWQEHLVEEGINDKEHRERHRQDAASRVKAGLVLSEISAQEGVDLAEGELEARLAELKSQYRDHSMQAELDTPQARQDIAARLLTEKTIAKLVAYASK